MGLVLFLSLRELQLDTKVGVNAGNFQQTKSPSYPILCHPLTRSFLIHLSWSNPIGSSGGVRCNGHLKAAEGDAGKKYRKWLRASLQTLAWVLQTRRVGFPHQQNTLRQMMTSLISGQRVLTHCRPALTSASSLEAVAAIEG